MATAPSKTRSAKIWELADPVVSPAYTPGLEGTPNEVRSNSNIWQTTTFADLSGDAPLKEAISDYIRHKDEDLKGQMVSQGTTPRRLTDLIGSLADLTSGSGDKGTPDHPGSGLLLTTTPNKNLCRAGPFGVLPFL